MHPASNRFINNKYCIEIFILLEIVMFKKIFICFMAGFSLSANAKETYSAPNCAVDPDGQVRIIENLTASFTLKGKKAYSNKLVGANISLLSSEEIGLQEKQSLLNRRIKQDGVGEDQKERVKDFEGLYLNNPVFKQFYKITTPTGFKVIAEYYSLTEGCSDLVKMYIISDEVDGASSNYSG